MISGHDPLARRLYEKLVMERQRKALAGVIAQIWETLSPIVNDDGNGIAPGALPPLAGDVTGPPGTNMVVKVQGVAVSTTDPAAGQFLGATGSATAEWTANPVTAHATAGDPHPLYALDTDLSTHAAAADPHAGYLLESLLDAKGDLLAATADNVPARVPVGTNGQVLTANSAVAPGVEWAPPTPVGQYRAWTYTAFAAGEFTYVVDGSGNPVYALMDLE